MEAKNLNDLLEEAIRYEIKSQQFYAQALERAENTSIKNFLKELIEEEKTHERMLRSIKEMEIYDGSIPVNDEILAKIAQSHDTAEEEISGDLTIDTILQIALKREHHAYNLFTAMEALVSEAELKTLFGKLAKEEQSHHKNIEQKSQAHKGEMGFEG